MPQCREMTSWETGEDGWTGSGLVDPVLHQLELFVDFLCRTDQHIGSLVSGDRVARSALPIDVVVSVAPDGDIVSAA